MAKAAADQRRDGMGPIYRRLLERERDSDRRYRALGRPRVLLNALERGETVEVEFWRVPAELLPPGSGNRIVVTPDM